MGNKFTCRSFPCPLITSGSGAGKSFAAHLVMFYCMYCAVIWFSDLRNPVATGRRLVSLVCRWCMVEDYVWRHGVMRVLKSRSKLFAAFPITALCFLLIHQWLIGFSFFWFQLATGALFFFLWLFCCWSCFFSVFLILNFVSPRLSLLSFSQVLFLLQLQHFLFYFCL